MKLLTTVFLLLATATISLAQTTWTLDKSHTDIRFTVTHMTISEVDGEFKQFDGKVVSTQDDFDHSEVEFTAQVASINTDNERRDGHLKSEDFFDAETYPEVSFSGKIQKEGDDYFLVGDFTMRGVTKEVKFDVTYNGQIPGRRGAKAGFKINGKVDRFDYGVKWDRTFDTGSLVVGREVQITCNVELNEVVPEGE